MLTYDVIRVTDSITVYI